MYTGRKSFRERIKRNKKYLRLQEAEKMQSNFIKNKRLI